MNYQKTVSMLLILVMMASLSICAFADDTIVIGGEGESPSEPAIIQDPANLGQGTADTATEQPAASAETQPAVQDEVQAVTPAETESTPVKVDPVISVSPADSSPVSADPITTEPTTANPITPAPDASASQGNTFKITKSPLSEPNIIAGNGTSFTAKAENASSVTWHVLNEKGTEVSSDQWANYGISVTSSDPANSKISIHNASTKISGWSFYAVFTGAGTSATTDRASIIVTPASAAIPSMTPRPVVTPIPTVAPTPVPTEVPVSTPVPTTAPVSTPIPEASFAPMVTPDPALSVASAATQARSSSSSSIMPILIVVICGLVIAMAAVTAILFANGAVGNKRRH